MTNLAQEEHHPQMLDAVLAYAARGWYVFPANLADGAKKSHKSKEYSNGQNWGKTTDPEEIRRDFAQWPKAVGIAAGAESGIFVVEADTPKGHSVDGLGSMKELERRYGVLPLTLQAESPTGSRHWYFKWPVGKSIINSSSKVAPGVDVRGEGGMVIAPPSVRGDGEYRWLNDVPVADAPDWIVALATGKTTNDNVVNFPAPDWLLAKMTEHAGKGVSTDADDLPPTVKEIKAALSVIPADGSEEEWWRAAAALHDRFGGSKEGFDIFHEWSATGGAKYKGERECFDKWRHSASKTDIHIGTLFYIADKYDPTWRDRIEDKGPSTRRLLRTSGEFVADFTAPDYLIDGILLRGFLYSLTAPTGHGKTAVALLISLHAAIGRALGEHHGVDKIKVLYFAGENDIDVQMRWIKTCEENDLDPNDVDVIFMPGVEKLSDEKFQAQLMSECEELGPFSLMFVDTSAAYSEMDDDNANMQQQEHARILRGFTKTLPGCPTVIVLCHPVKTPNMDSLIPKGGGNFLNAIDGNLCCKMDRRTYVVELHTAGKFRGAEFAPIAFALKFGTSEKIKDNKGRLIKTVTARLISDEEKADLEGHAREEQTNLLLLLNENDRLSMAKAAEQLGWSKSRVQRLIEAMRVGKYIEKDASDRYVITDKGKSLINERLKEQEKM